MGIRYLVDRLGGSIILLIIGCFIAIIVIKSTHGKNDILRFVARDLNGQVIRSDELLGQISFLVFLDDRDPNDQLFIRTADSALSEFGIENAVAFLDKNNDFSYKLDCLRLANILKSDQLLSRFDARGHYFLYDKKGGLFHSGKTADALYGLGDLRYYLAQLVLHKYFDMHLFIDESQSLIDSSHLSQIYELILNNHKEYSVISLVSSICNVCGSGKIIGYLDDIHHKYGDKAYVALVVRSEYDDKEIEALRSQARISYPIFRASEELRRKWNELIAEYRERDLSDIVIFVRGDENIVSLLDNNCGCATPYFEHIGKTLSAQLSIQ